MEETFVDGRTWRDVAAAIAGPRAKLVEVVVPAPALHDFDDPDDAGDPVPVQELTASVEAHVSFRSRVPFVPSGSFMVSRPDADDAWCEMAHNLAEHRLEEALTAAGWSSVDQVIDQATFIAAQDPGGSWWAIGVATASATGYRAAIASEIELDDRAYDRVAFIEPIDAVDRESIFAALHASA